MEPILASTPAGRKDGFATSSRHAGSHHAAEVEALAVGALRQKLEDTLHAHTSAAWTYVHYAPRRCWPHNPVACTPAFSGWRRRRRDPGESGVPNLKTPARPSCDPPILRLIIQEKIAAGRLPHAHIPRIWGRPGQRRDLRRLRGDRDQSPDGDGESRREGMRGSVSRRVFLPRNAERQAHESSRPASRLTPEEARERARRESQAVDGARLDIGGSRRSARSDGR